MKHLQNSAGFFLNIKWILQFFAQKWCKFSRNDTSTIFLSTPRVTVVLIAWKLWKPNLATLRGAYTRLQNVDGSRWLLRQNKFFEVCGVVFSWILSPNSSLTDHGIHLNLGRRGATRSDLHWATCKHIFPSSHTTPCNLPCVWFQVPWGETISKHLWQGLDYQPQKSHD